MGYRDQANRRNLRTGYKYAACYVQRLTLLQQQPTTSVLQLKKTPTSHTKAVRKGLGGPEAPHLYE